MKCMLHYHQFLRLLRVRPRRASTLREWCSLIFFSKRITRLAENPRFDPSSTTGSVVLTQNCRFVGRRDGGSEQDSLGSRATHSTARQISVGAIAANGSLGSFLERWTVSVSVGSQHFGEPLRLCGDEIVSIRLLKPRLPKRCDRVSVTRCTISGSLGPVGMNTGAKNPTATQVPSRLHIVRASCSANVGLPHGAQRPFALGGLEGDLGDRGHIRIFRSCRDRDPEAV